LRIGGNSYARGGYGRRGRYPYLGYCPYGYCGLYWDPLYDSGDQDAYADSSASGYRDDSGVQSDSDPAGGKLQSDIDAANRPAPAPEPATELVFRDQHVEEVHNYAISGGMLWVVNEQAARKIPLAQLDLPATVRMNDDRGVDFQVPGPLLQIQIVR
jgi:hypothetical protein